jgi:phage tail-like protein
MAAGVSRYVAHLPAVFQDDDFVGAFLLAFERILTGLPGGDPPNLPAVPLGLEQILDTIETYFDPASAPAEFLPWLAGWVATSLREDWDTATRRSFIEHIVPLYRRRGTARALQGLLQIYLNPTRDPLRDASVEVLEAPKPGDPTYPTPYPPRYFQVRFTVVERDPVILARRASIATEIIDREKPAHTYYGLFIGSASLQIADPPTFDSSTPPYPITGVFVGVNTLLGTTTFKSS